MSMRTGRISRMAVPPRITAPATLVACRQLRRAWAARAVTVCGKRRRVGMYPHGEEPGSVDRGQEATGGAVENEAAILPGCALTKTRQPLHVAPNGTGVRLVRFRQRVRLGGLLQRQIESP